MNTKTYICAVMAVFLFASSLRVTAQGVAATQSAAMPFMATSPDARSAAMAGASVAAADGVGNLYGNFSASLFSYPDGAVAYSTMPLMRGVSDGYALNTIAGYFRPDEKQAIGIGRRGMKYPEMAFMDDEGNQTGSVSPRESTFDVAYARRLGKSFAVSATVRYAFSGMGTLGGAESAHTFGFDLGASYHGAITGLRNAWWSAGAVLSNMGGKIKYLETSYRMPATFTAGGAAGSLIADNHAIMGALDLRYAFQPSDAANLSASLGAEYSYLGVGFLRAGYALGNSGKSTGNYGSLGCGLHLWHVRCDFAWTLADRQSAMRNNWALSFALQF